MNEKLTGNIRHNSRRIGGIFSKQNVLVLQVECTWGDGPSDSNGMPEYLRGRGWRDATVKDFSYVLVAGSAKTQGDAA